MRSVRAKTHMISEVLQSLGFWTATSSHWTSISSLMIMTESSVIGHRMPRISIFRMKLYLI